jgi:hypothetical protein
MPIRMIRKGARIVSSVATRVQQIIHVPDGHREDELFQMHLDV